jgi:cellular nucleic acid-binding protein
LFIFLSSLLGAEITDVLSNTVGHIAENCTSQERLCYNCRKPGHESSTCTEPRTVAAKQCYSCGGIGHIQAECPTLRLQGSNQKCYVRAAVMLGGIFMFFFLVVV